MDSKAGETVPRPLGETVPGSRPGEVIHFDCLYVGASGPLGDDDLDEDGGYSYILVMVDDMNNRVWLEPTGVCKTGLTAQHLLASCKTIGVPKVWVNDTASHFNNRMMVALEKSLGVDRGFSVANSPWSNDICERMMQSMVEVQSQLHEEILDKVQANRGKQRVAASRGNLMNVTVGEYVLVARVRRSGSTPKLLIPWTGPWRMVVPQRPQCRTSFPGRFETSMLFGCVSTRMPLSRSLPS